jgi:hypothetical protein
MGITLPMAMLISSLVGAGVSTGTAIAGNMAQKNAQKKALKAQEEATNRANQKTPDASAILKAAQAGAGNATLLTDPNAAPNLSLGKTSLLGA